MLRRVVKRGFLFFGFLALTGGIQAHEITFELIPAELLGPHRKAEDRQFLSDGTIRLYRRGTSRPFLEANVGKAVAVPAGEWTWIGEGPGFVTTSAGVLHLPKGPSRARTIVWPVERACTVELAGRPWTGAERVDFVSIPFGSTYLKFPDDTRTLQIPAGEFLYYTVTPRGPGAISEALSCTPEERVPVVEPGLPSRGRQDVMVIARGEGELARKTGRVMASAKMASGETIPPTTHTFAEGWAAFFFLGLPAAGPLEVALSHPELRTERISLEPMERSVREASRNLRDRLTLEVPIDYRPLRPHHLAMVRLLSCGPDDPVRTSRCEPRGETRGLQEGLAHYRFEGLDGERFILEARIDDEVLPGLGSNEVFDLRNEEGPVVQAQVELLREHHIFGHVLMDGEPVPGEVRWQPLGSGASRTRVFPTEEEDDQYHLFYFGIKQSKELKGMYPQSLWKSLEKGLWGMGHGRGTLAACDGDGYCKPFHIFSSFTGDGRLDFDLGSGERWRLQVLDSESRTPVPGADVLIGAVERERHVVHFSDGRRLPPDRIPGEALVQTTDHEGRASLLGLGVGSKVVVRAEGYQSYRSELPAPGSEVAELTVELEPLDTTQGLQVLLEGKPVDRGVLLVLGGDPGEEARCARPIGRDGRLYLPEVCREPAGRRFLLAHPEAELWQGSVAELPKAGEVSLRRRRGPALSFRLLESDGEPLPGLPLGFEIGDVELDTNRLILLARGGMPNLHQTDSDGRVTWPFFSHRGPLPGLLIPELGVVRRLFPEPAASVLDVFIDTYP